MKLPEIYEYSEGDYDNTNYFNDEMSEDGSTWCKAVDTVAMYQLTKERIEELQERIYEYDTAVLNVLKHGLPPLALMHDEELYAFQTLKRVFESGGLR